jgi:hypothetical protein
MKIVKNEGSTFMKIKNPRVPISDSLRKLMDDDVWDDKDESNVLPQTSSNDKFEKDLDKLREIHSNVTTSLSLYRLMV